LAGGHSGWPVHGEVAGSRGGEVAGKKGGDGAELDWFQGRGEEVAEAGARRGSDRGRCAEMRGSGWPFYRRPRRGRWRPSGTSEARRGGNNGGTVVATGRLGAGGGEWSPGHSARRRKTPNLASE
jgi:hypothetical protein